MRDIRGAKIFITTTNRDNAHSIHPFSSLLSFLRVLELAIVENSDDLRCGIISGQSYSGGDIDMPDGHKTVDINNTIGKRVRAARLSRGVSLIDLAKSAGCSSDMLHKYEAGLVFMTAGMLVVISDALGMNAAQLLDQNAHTCSNDYSKCMQLLEGLSASGRLADAKVALQQISEADTKSL